MVFKVESVPLWETASGYSPDLVHEMRNLGAIYGKEQVVQAAVHFTGLAPSPDLIESDPEESGEETLSFG